MVNESRNNPFLLILHQTYGSGYMSLEMEKKKNLMVAKFFK